MNKSDNNMSCAEFQAHFPELFGGGEMIGDHPHLQRCNLCRALLADLNAIAEAARELFPVEDPPHADALWEHIESAIAHEGVA